jgi:hypothetical protein
VSDRLLRTVLRAQTRVRGARPDRGDVPGWVMITVMTAGIVMLLWGVAGPALSTLMTNAIDSVKTPTGK